MTNIKKYIENIKTLTSKRILLIKNKRIKLVKLVKELIKNFRKNNLSFYIIY